MPAAFAEDFIITHFFNPPRYMRLLEMVTGPKSTRPDALATVAEFADVALGKSVIALQGPAGLHRQPHRRHLDAERRCIEALRPRPRRSRRPTPSSASRWAFPRPACSACSTSSASTSCRMSMRAWPALLPKDDPFHAAQRDVPLIDKMIADGYTGRKGKGGFYRHQPRRRRQGQGGDRSRDRRPTGPRASPSSSDLRRAGDLERAARHADRKAGRYAWRVLAPTLAYAAALVARGRPTTSPSVDEAMRLGYNWKFGPVRADRPARRRLARRRTGRGRHRRCRRCCASAAGRPFYRVEGGSRQYLGLDGDYHDLVAARGRAAARGHQARRGKPVLKNGSAACGTSATASPASSSPAR